jgi:lipid-binding SYLF domain-containing protein
MSPKGGSTAEKRQSMLQVRDATMESLYSKRPETRKIVENSAGYGVFTNLGTNIIFVSTNNGYGVVTSRSSDKPTYMKVAGLGAALGIGVKDFRAVFVFQNQETLNKFVSEGWDWGGGGDATAMLSGEGGELTGSTSFHDGIMVYQFTESGVMLGAALHGTKYWPDNKLND